MEFDPAMFNPGDLERKIGDLEITPVGDKALRVAGFAEMSLREFAMKTDAELLQIPNFRRWSLNHLKKRLAFFGLRTGMVARDFTVLEEAYLTNKIDWPSFDLGPLDERLMGEFIGRSWGNQELSILISVPVRDKLRVLNGAQVTLRISREALLPPHLSDGDLLFSALACPSDGSPLPGRCYEVLVVINTAARQGTLHIRGFAPVSSS